MLVLDTLSLYKMSKNTVSNPFGHIRQFFKIFNGETRQITHVKRL